MKKQAYFQANPQPATTQMMAKINAFAKTTLQPQDVYTFRVVLCDNEVDRDFERFSKESLEALAPMFVGKTGIFDHDPKASHQTARIFETAVEADATRKTADGAPYVALTAGAYMLRNEKNQALMEEIEAGIKKEVSVSCAVGQVLCSVCGKDYRTEGCNHIRGKTYGKNLCVGILEHPTDAYEWSFVAVPAQRNAGVTKSFIQEESMDTTKILKSIAAGEAVTLSTDQSRALQGYLLELKSLAQEGKAYREALEGETARLAVLAVPGLQVETVKALCKGADFCQLRQLKNAFAQKAGVQTEAQPQLTPKAQTADNTMFKL